MVNAATLVLSALLMAGPHPPPRAVPPVLSFPEPGMDDPAAYEGYRTRFWKDAAGNAVQVYLNAKTGRTVMLWADAADESLGFTARDASGKAAALDWGADDAVVAETGGKRTISIRLRLPAAPVELGFFQLGSMRIERDLQYAGAELRPFDAPPFVPPELVGLVNALQRLDPAERQRELALLGARSPEELRRRLTPLANVFPTAGPAPSLVRLDATSLDGRDRLSLELSVPAGTASLEFAGRVLHVRPLRGEPVILTLTASTTAAALHPLTRAEIFRPSFLAFYARVRAARDSALAAGAPATDRRIARFRWLEREVRGVELVSYREKLMAGLPNFATYFGRDDMLTALLMRPIWNPAMEEAVIGAVLRKLAPTGDVSHEEALGGQAIREHAAVYDSLVGAWAARRAAGDAAGAAAALAAARTLLGHLQQTRENYRMVDDEFQLPVVVESWLDDAGVSDARRRAFLLAPASGGAGGANESRLIRLLRELAFVARRTRPYVLDPVPTKLVDFIRLPDGRCQSGSWRDSGAGYGGGCFAMDVNAIWVPAALRSLEAILAGLRHLGYDAPALTRLAPELRGTPLEAYARDGASLRHAIEVWDGAATHFLMSFSPEEARRRVAQRLAALPAEERAVWSALADSTALGQAPLRFLAISLDREGRPIGIASTDPAMRLLLGPPAADPAARAADLRDVRMLVLRYPLGLMIDGVGPVAANDAYATPAVWEAFRTDLYHSPRSIWGREVNVALAGIARRIDAAYDGACRPRAAGAVAYARELRSALDHIAAAVDASGLQHHELWSYRVVDGRVLPLRYETSSDVQLWNLTDLATQFALERVPRCVAGTASDARPAARVSGHASRRAPDPSR